MPEEIRTKTTHPARVVKEGYTERVGFELGIAECVGLQWQKRKERRAFLI